MIPQQLSERHRPTTFDDVVGQDAAIGTIRRLIGTGLGGRAIWLSGQSGTGKTTLARLVAAEIADPFWVTELDATELNADTLRGIESECRLYGGGKGGRAFIVNEAHGLRQEIIRRLLKMLEPIPAHVFWIFTTTNDGQAKLFDDAIDAGPLLSRCTPVALARQGLAKPFAAQAQSIAQSEGLDGRPIASYVRLVQDHHNNMRAVLQAIEAGAMLTETGAKQ